MDRRAQFVNKRCRQSGFGEIEANIHILSSSENAGDREITHLENKNACAQRKLFKQLKTAQIVLLRSWTRQLARTSVDRSNDGKTVYKREQIVKRKAPTA